MMKNVLGILGGMGPMASALFYKMITEKIGRASCRERV